ncbi:MAG: hypothetical protein NTV68_12920 [Methanomicrobiales archaeon]|nr:hypothetical protein [Methanomicrobiales archaeon]
MNEVRCNGSSDSRTTKKENTTAISHVCDCNDKSLSPANKHDQEQKDALLAARSVHQVLEQQIMSRNLDRMELELATVLSEINRLESTLLVFSRPGCFGCYKCTDHYLETCQHGDACREKWEGRFRSPSSQLLRYSRG